MSRSEFFCEMKLLDTYRSFTKKLLVSTLNQPHNQSLTLKSRPNHTSSDHVFLQRLMDDPHITIKPADKNLGLAMVDTSWYNAELNRMLSDISTYQPVDTSMSISDLKVRLLLQLQTIAKTNERTIKEWQPDTADQTLRYLRDSMSLFTTDIPGIYLLIKVHKPKGLCGRPIVPATKWITTPASVVVDHLLQEIFKKANIPWIVKDTKSLVNELEGMKMPSRTGVFLTADIASLYTNIDTKMGLELVRQFLIELSIPPSHIFFIMDLLTFVMNNSYLHFCETVYLQIDGTAMGTATAPTYANIVVYMLEKKVLERFKQQVYMYRRYLDDVVVYVEPSAADAFKLALNSLHSKLIFEFAGDDKEATFLDLTLYKGNRFHHHQLFDFRVHQKNMNLYLYIPYHSFHTDAMKRSFIQTELMRYIRNSSDRDHYVDIKKMFYQRLRGRGYPIHFLDVIFESIFYVDRKYFLVPSEELLNHPDIHDDPPRSACLLRRLTRAKQQQQTLEWLKTCSISPSQSSQPPIFIIPYTPVSHIVRTRHILTRHWATLETAAGLVKPIIAYQSLPNIMKLLVYAKAKRHEKHTRFAIGGGSQRKKMEPVTGRAGGKPSES